MTPGYIHIGSAFYPEHWTREDWVEDIRLMKAAGFTVARVGEFAWSRFEPEEGTYDFGWMDEAIAMLADSGISTVMGTPTAAPPAWMVQKYPEVLRTGSDGRKVQFGNRLHYCVESPQYQTFTRRLVEAMGAHFAGNPHIIGWQIDNEFGMECHCSLCRKAFQDFLKEKFGTLEFLNARWTTAYWSQTYTDWSQVELPRHSHNPGLLMAYRQYFTGAYRRYQKFQIDALRKFIPDEQWITHNFHGGFHGHDHYKLAEDLDMASYDYYVGSGHNDAGLSGFKWDLARGLKQQNFWVMETQPGSVNWSSLNTKLNKGETRALNWQAIGHGADAILYWQWRSALNGQEQYHGSLVDQAGQPRPFYEEAAEIGDDFNRVRAVLENTKTVQNRVAILFDFESRWSLENQPHHERFDYWEGLLKYYRPFQEKSIGVDILSPDADLTHYKLVIVPYMAVIDDRRAEKLIAYAKGGGNVIMTCRTAFKDHFDAMLPERPPA
ncbi:MAG: beta-galactosidase, partial [Anaerolineae bacterium]|nr:beta-galactosidase [Anaerolineae bacterium]